MVSDEVFYSSFRDTVIGPDPDPDDITGKSHQVSFLMHHYNMTPLKNRDLFCNFTRAFPTSPLCIFSAWSNWNEYLAKDGCSTISWRSYEGRTSWGVLQDICS